MAVYKTRNWTFNSLNNEVIFADGKVTQLAARHNACLKALLDAQGQTVDYETLLLTVWGTTHRDNNTIASVISELRKKICSADPDFKYITTIPKKGYRFNGYDDVSILSIDEFKSQPQPQANDGNQQPAPTQIPKNQLSRSIRPPKLSSVLIILMALALCALWYFSNNSSEQKKSEFEHELLTFDRGIEYTFAVSQDKKMLFYVNEQESHQTIVLKNLLTSVKHSVVFDQGVTIVAAAFANDGNSLAFIERTSDSCQLSITRIADNRLMLDDKRILTSCDTGGYMLSPHFSKADDAIFYARTKSESDPYVIVKHDLNTGYERNLTSPPSIGRGDYGIALNPSGTHLAFVRDEYWEQSGVWTLELKTGVTTKLFVQPVLLDKIDWVNDNSVMFSKGKELVSYSIDSHDFDQVYQSSVTLNAPQVIGGTIYLSRGNFFDSKVVSLDLTKLSLTSRKDTLYSEYGATSPQSDHSYFFFSNRLGQFDIWQSNRGNDTLLSSAAELKDASNLTDIGDALLVVNDGQLLKVDKSSGQVSLLKSDFQHIENYSYSAHTNKLVYGKEINESWYLEAFNLSTNQAEPIGVHGYTGHYLGNDIYLTKFREPGLWKYNPYTGDSELIIADFEVYFSDKWAVTSEQVILLKEKEIRIWQNRQGYPLTKSIVLDEDPRRIRCSELKCNLDLRSLGSSDIIQVH